MWLSVGRKPNAGNYAPCIYEISLYALSIYDGRLRNTFLQV